ncbi:spore cortex-lytic enzyme [Kroppenstedtia pulmonis]|uniref:Spore cortex-lytic enzyme n=1 Tax=Kroppenstedtia pulmonis TaxID=1380685 RepID=A0A7D4CH66_9BACL|nr:spore cortex-lytic enzyme [Kroppenstedtia pulmonis]QKG85314.1 spore cortex-lytic enzyme [Kroppenstedtia pulmonis]
MLKKKMMVGCTALALFLTGLFLPVGKQAAKAASPTQVHYGSKNGDVWDLQNRLIRLGYKITLDGIYGLETEKAVVRYQKSRNLRIDGIAGPQTWKSIKVLTDQQGSKQGKKTLSEEEMTWLARAVYSEARGEPYKGQVAVAAVVLNRVKSPQHPNTVKGVVLEKGAFTAVDDGQIWLNPNSQAYKAARDAVNGWDPSEGATFYFNPDTATSKWIWSRPQINKIGKHIFAK